VGGGWGDANVSFSNKRKRDKKKKEIAHQRDASLTLGVRAGLAVLVLGALGGNLQETVSLCSSREEAHRLSE
jgi:hypothetical protein